MSTEKKDSGKNFQGKSFKGQNLMCADFSNANIQGADFTEANLTGANFTNAKAGLQNQWAITLVVVFVLFLSLGVVILAFASVFIVSLFTPEKLGSGFISLALLAIFFYTVDKEGLGSGKGVSPGWANAAALMAFILTIAALIGLIFHIGEAPNFALIATIWVCIWIGGWCIIATNLAIYAVIGDRNKSRNIAIVTLLIAIFLLGVVRIVAMNGSLSVALAAIGVGFFVNIAEQALDENNDKYTSLRRIAFNFAARGGTNFKKADLTNANFTKAILKNTDLTGAILIQTSFSQTLKINLAITINTYLENPNMRELVTKRIAKDCNFDHLNLEGVNLYQAELENASFIGTNLSNANLQEANLKNATLAQTQLDGTDLTGATLTGACIEDWNITRSTKFNDVKCKYVFMRLITKDNKESFRKPDNSEEYFADGGFSDFIKPIFDTLDLYHTQNIDPRAIAIALKNLAANNPDAQLEIKAMEKRGDNFLIRLATSLEANRSELSAEYFNDYNELKLLNQKQQAILLERDNRIKSLENMIAPILNRPILYAENYYNQGDTMSDKSSNFKFGNVSGDVAGIAGGDISGIAGKDLSGLAGGDISGIVTASIGQLTKSEALEALKLADLLKQLQSAIESDIHLSEKDKVKALKQVQTLAEASQNPKDEDKKDLADTAIIMLKGIVTGLPAVAACVKACQELLPLITSVLGL